MQSQLSSPDRNGGRHVALLAHRAGGEVVALCSGADNEVAFGGAFEIALARVGDVTTAPEWVQVFPAGPDIVARDGRRWKLPDPQVLVSAYARNRAELPFDIEHATEILAPKGQPAPAQAWIKEVAVRADGTTWVRPDWTAAGAVAVTSRAYKYVSPAFRFTESGEIVALTSVALTTQPALDLPALARSEGGAPHTKQETHMSTLLARLVAAYGLAAAATEDDVVNAATTQVALARDARDPTKLVPAADLTTALARATTAETALTAIQTEAKEKAATGAVETAIADGKIAPASKEHWVALARENPEAFNSAIAAMPKGLTPTNADKKIEGGAAATDELGLTVDQVALCRDLSLDPKAYAATLKEQGQ